MNPLLPQPPRVATALLRVCCTRVYRDEIEGDLYELFARRALRSGVPHARRRYALDVSGVCLRQLSARLLATLTRIHRGLWLIGALAVAFVLIAKEQRWAIMTGCALLFGLGVIELLVYLDAACSLVRALARPARERLRKR